MGLPLDLIIIVALSLLMVPLTVLTGGLLRAAIGAIFILFFPGYTLAAAFYHRPDALDRIERVALSFGLSIAVVPLIGLALNYSPWGIRPYPMVFSLLAFIITMAAIAWKQRQKLSVEQGFQPPVNPGLSVFARHWGSQGIWDKLFTVLIATAILGAFGTLVYMVAQPVVGEKFTEFYVLGPDGRAAGYPRRVVLGEEATVRLGVVNRESQEMEYRVEVSVGGTIAPRIGPLHLSDSEKWEEDVILKPTVVGADQKVVFRLFKEEVGQPYSSLHIWLDVVSPADQ